MAATACVQRLRHVPSTVERPADVPNPVAAQPWKKRRRAQKANLIRGVVAGKSDPSLFATDEVKVDGGSLRQLPPMPPGMSGRGRYPQVDG